MKMQAVSILILLIGTAKLLTMPSAALKALPQIRPSGKCLPASEFTLSGVPVHRKEGMVRKVLGKPDKITRERGEDDGGEYIATVLHYKHLRVEIVRGDIDRLYSGSPKARTPSGLRPGLNYTDVKRILGDEPRPANGCEFCYVSCNESRPAYMSLKFDRNRVLSSIEVIVDRP